MDFTAAAEGNFFLQAVDASSASFGGVKALRPRIFRPRNGSIFGFDFGGTEVREKWRVVTKTMDSRSVDPKVPGGVSILGATRRPPTES